VGAYTHLFFAFAFIDPNTFVVAPMSDEDKELYPRFTGLKTYNPGLETWVRHKHYGAPRFALLTVLTRKLDFHWRLVNERPGSTNSADVL
jgi:hypothetical protein